MSGKSKTPQKVASVEEPATGPCLIDGGLQVDVRGKVGFVNGFDLKHVDRLYWVRAHQPNCPRGWVGHRREQKWFWVLQGEMLLAVVRPDRWSTPARDLPVQCHVLSASKPQVLHVPPGYCTASVDLAGGAILLVCSSGRIEEAKTDRRDDFRFAPDYWKIPE